MAGSALTLNATVPEPKSYGGGGTREMIDGENEEEDLRMDWEPPTCMKLERRKSCRERIVWD